LHLPILRSLAEYHLRAVASRTTLQAKTCAEQFGADYFTTDHTHVLEDEKIDAVLICTRHHLHAQQAIQAAQAGKDIFVEKPPAMTEAECAALALAVGRSGVRFTVGFNRRLAPHTLKMKELLARRPGPVVVHYRVNAGFFPADHWIHDPVEGGGRILGEACHFVNFFDYLLGASLVEIYAQAVPVNQQTVVALDNIAATFKYADGSLATLSYTSLGHAGLGKEYVEIFVPDGAMVLDDYRQLRLYGFGREKAGSLKKQDKGFLRQWQEFAKLVRGEPSLCPTLEEALASTRHTLQLLACLHGHQEKEQT